MNGSATERAALLSARIHRRFNREGNVMDRRDFEGIGPHEDAAFWFGFAGNGGIWFGDNEDPSVFSRLGTELRAIVLGNRGTT